MNQAGALFRAAYAQGSGKSKCPPAAATATATACSKAADPAAQDEQVLDSATNDPLGEGEAGPAAAGLGGAVFDEDALLQAVHERQERLALQTGGADAEAERSGSKAARPDRKVPSQNSFFESIGKQAAEGLFGSLSLWQLSPPGAASHASRASSATACNAQLLPPAPPAACSSACGGDAAGILKLGSSGQGCAQNSAWAVRLPPPSGGTMRDDDDQRQSKVALHDRALDRDESTQVTAAMATTASPDDSAFAEFVREVVEEAAGEDSHAAARMPEQGNVAAWMHTDAAPHSSHRQVNVDGTMGSGQRPGEVSEDLRVDALTLDLIDWTQALASGTWDSKEAAPGGQARGQEKENPEEGIQEGDGAEYGCGTGRQTTDKLVTERLMAASVGKCLWRVADLGLCRYLFTFLRMCSWFALSPFLRVWRHAVELSARCHAVLPPSTGPLAPLTATLCLSSNSREGQDPPTTYPQAWCPYPGKTSTRANALEAAAATCCLPRNRPPRLHPLSQRKWHGDRKERKKPYSKRQFRRIECTLCKQAYDGLRLIFASLGNQ